MPTTLSNGVALTRITLIAKSSLLGILIWVILTRKHAKIIIKDDVVFPMFQQHCQDCRSCELLFVIMATGFALASITSLKSRDNGLGFAKASDFIQVSDMKRVRFQGTKITVIKNSNPGSDIAELRPASEGSPLLVPVQKYCESTHKTIRRKTRTVMVGDVALGSEHPIRIQTMTTTDTKYVAATVEQRWVVDLNKYAVKA